MLQQSTINFLTSLKDNNNREWFDQHKDQYLQAKEDFESCVEKLIKGLSQFEPDIAALQVKDCTFRIYRDVRFAKDKRPYKTNMAAGFNKGGKKVHFPGYYFHLEPGNNSFVGGGMWNPAPSELKKIRQEIDYNLKAFEAILHEQNFKKQFGELRDENSLVRAPQGYKEDNPAIHYLKMKSFVTGRSLPDELLTSKKLGKEILQVFLIMKPFIDFLQRSLD